MFTFFSHKILVFIILGLLTEFVRRTKNIRSQYQNLQITTLLNFSIVLQQT